MDQSDSHLNKAVKLFAVLLASLQLALTISQHVQFRSGFFLGDANVYAQAINRYLNGGNAYDLSIHPRFIYHPFFLHVFGLAGNHAKDVLMLLYVLSGVYLLKSLSESQKALYPALLAFCYSGVGFEQFAVGHITLPLHFFLLAPLIKGIKSSKELNIYVLMVAFSAFIKPYMLAYMLIPIVASTSLGELTKKHTIRYILAILIGMIGLVALDYLFYPDLTLNFLIGLHRQTLVDGDIGQGFFHYYFKLSGLTGWSIVLHIMTTTLLFGPVLYYFWRRPVSDNRSGLLYVYFFLTMVNPRLKEFDMSAALMAIFLSWSLLNPKKRIDWLLFLAFGVSGLRLIILYNQHQNPMVTISGFEFYLTILVMIIGYIYKLSRYSGTTSSSLRASI